MPQLDKLKEEIGYLKNVFNILFASDLSLIGWLVVHYDKQTLFLNILNLFTILAVTLILILLNRTIYKKIDKVGEL